MNASDWGKSNRELQEPCEYCGDKISEQKALVSINGNITLRVGIMTFAKFYDDGYGWQDDLFRINYCPMCGRKLREL